MAWPWNQPGWKAMAPPVVGQYVRFVVVGWPPPAGKGGMSAYLFRGFFALAGREAGLG